MFKKIIDTHIENIKREFTETGDRDSAYAQCFDLAQKCASQQDNRQALLLINQAIQYLPQNKSEERMTKEIKCLSARAMFRQPLGEENPAKTVKENLIDSRKAFNILQVLINRQPADRRNKFIADYNMVFYVYGHSAVNLPCVNNYSKKDIQIMEDILQDNVFPYLTDRFDRLDLLIQVSDILSERALRDNAIESLSQHTEHTLKLTAELKSLKDPLLARAENINLLTFIEAKAYNWIGTIQVNIDQDLVSAEKNLRKAVEINNHPRFKVLLAGFLNEDKHDYDEAFNFILEAKKQYKDDPGLIAVDPAAYNYLDNF